MKNKFKDSMTTYLANYYDERFLPNNEKKTKMNINTK